MNWQDILSQALVYVLGIIVVPSLLSWATATVLNFISSWETNKHFKNRGYVQEAMLTLEELVVAENELVVKGLKAAAADGKLTPAEAAKIKNEVLSEFFKVVPPHVQTILREVKGDVMAWASRMIEYIIATVIKKRLPNSPPPSPV